MLPDDVRGVICDSVYTHKGHRAGNRHGCFPAPPRSSSPNVRKLPLGAHTRTRCSTGGPSALAMSVLHIRRTCRRQHWRHAKRLSPTIPDTMILNWCAPERTHTLDTLEESPRAILKRYMIILVDVRCSFLAAHDDRGAFMIDAGLARLANILRTTAS